jgi:hypothetical protein
MPKENPRMHQIDGSAASENSMVDATQHESKNISNLMATIREMDLKDRTWNFWVSWQNLARFRQGRSDDSVSGLKYKAFSTFGTFTSLPANNDGDDDDEEEDAVE